MKQIFLIIAITILLCSGVFAQQTEWHGWYVGASAALNNDGTAQTVKDNFAPQLSAIIRLGSSGNTYYLPGLTWKSNNGWLQFEALSIYTQVATLKWGAVFVGGSATPLTLSTNAGVKREDIVASGLDVGVTIPLNQKMDRLYLAIAAKYHTSYNYNSTVPEADRIENAFILSVGLIGLNPLK